MKWVEKRHKARLNVEDTVKQKIAKIRGISDVDTFLNPTQEHLVDPYFLKNIEEAINRIIMAISNGEKIVVSYDCDADGISSATIMRRYLSNYTESVDYIFGERSNGHGIKEMLTLKGLNEVKDEKRIALNKSNIQKVKDADLLILIDSSSNDADVCGYIKEQWGTEIVIIDHHEIERENPHVLMVNPQQKDCEYPNKFISGAGLVFKVVQVMEDTLNTVDPFQYMDLVALGMYADVMRVDVLENRFMILHGLRNIKNAGLIRILKGAKIDTYNINCNAIGFGIAPLINGTTRMDEIELAIDLLMADDDKECKRLRLKMHKLNDARKERQKEITEQYQTKINSDDKVLIVLDDHSSKGFNGLIAQQLSDKYQRPAIVGRLHKGEVSGSFRSYAGFNFKNFLMESGLVKEAMGHNQAGGFVIKERNLEALKEYIQLNLPNMEDSEPTVIYDLELKVDEVAEFIPVIEEFNTLVGNGFPKVLVKVTGITVYEPECIGKTLETVKIQTLDDLELIKFRVNPKYASELSLYDTIDVVGQLQLNIWFNFKIKKRVVMPQILIDDYKVV